ncbi:hypothetical protein K457DRAFT_18878 [Linnemannia elongata AG-77]|uniref:Uncharacterized protein n=1 Tax=Linnemannia elongata AG-77 TaxID=1314771 RepID=A0A197JXL0_9FUNG|nr:hypothetical protein K457DRAFT_18878 [Linnemannia elongata AG-77]
MVVSLDHKHQHQHQQQATAITLRLRIQYYRRLCLKRDIKGSLFVLSLDALLPPGNTRPLLCCAKRFSLFVIVVFFSGTKFQLVNEVSTDTKPDQDVIGRAVVLKERRRQQWRKDRVKVERRLDPVGHVIATEEGEIEGIVIQDGTVD